MYSIPAFSTVPQRRGNSGFHSPGHSGIECPVLHFALTVSVTALAVYFTASAAELPAPFPSDPEQELERTCFQTGQGWSPARQPAVGRRDRLRH